MKFKNIILILIFTLNYTFAAKLISIGGSITETVVALGHKDDLIAIDLSSIYPKKELEGLPNVGYWLQLPQEGIVSMKPELVLASENSKPKKVLENLSKYGIKTYLIEDKPTIDSAIKKINQVAKALNEEQKAKEITKRLKKNITMIQKELKKVKKQPKVLFLFSRDKNTLMAAGQKTKPGTMIKLAGGENVVSMKSYTKISNESILQMNPDVIILTNHGGISKFENKNVSHVNAVKNNRIYSMDLLLISGFTVRTDKALKELSCKIHNDSLSFCKK